MNWTDEEIAEARCRSEMAAMVDVATFLSALDEISVLRIQLAEAQARIIDELIPQCNAAYAPYREAEQNARAEADRLGEALYAAQERIAQLESAPRGHVNSYNLEE